MSPTSLTVAARDRVGVRPRLLVVAALLVLAMAIEASPAAARGGSVSASCRQGAGQAGRDCTIRGTISGEYRYVSDTNNEVTRWNGTIVLRLASKADDRKYVIAKGSSVSWSTSGTSAGCTVSGGGTLGAADLQGGLSVGRLIRAGTLEPVVVRKKATNRVRLERPGMWEWHMAINNREPRGGEKLMPVTTNCSSGSSVRDIAIGFAKGFQFTDTDLTHPDSQQTETTDGTTLAGSSDNGLDTRMSWNLKGRVFADQIGAHGIQFIKTWEGWSKTAYNDSVGNCTIGYGTLLHLKPCTAADLKLKWTQKQADAGFPAQVQKAEYEGQIVAVSRAYGLNQCQFDALTSFVYNTGGVYGLTKQLPLDRWDSTIAQRLPTYITARNNAASKSTTGVGKNGNVSITFIDPQTGKPRGLPPGAKLTKGANGQVALTFTDPTTGKTYTMPVSTAAPTHVTLAGLVQRRGAEFRLFMAPSCPCQGVAGKTPSTVAKP